MRIECHGRNFDPTVSVVNEMTKSQFRFASMGKLARNDAVTKAKKSMKTDVQEAKRVSYMSYGKLFIICDIYELKEMQNRNNLTENRTNEKWAVSSHVDDKVMFI